MSSALQGRLIPADVLRVEHNGPDVQKKKKKLEPGSVTERCRAIIHQRFNTCAHPGLFLKSNTQAHPWEEGEVNETREAQRPRSLLQLVTSARRQLLIGRAWERETGERSAGAERCREEGTV